VVALWLDVREIFGCSDTRYPLVISVSDARAKSFPHRIATPLNAHTVGGTGGSSLTNGFSFDDDSALGTLSLRIRHQRL
jgi:hypothetical protein